MPKRISDIDMKRTEVRSHIIPEIKDWPVNHLYKNRKEFVQEVSTFTIDNVMERPAEEVSKIIARTAYLELIRIKEEPWKNDPVDEKQFWRQIRKEQGLQTFDMTESQRAASNRVLLQKIIDRYAEEIVGGFKPKTFRFARKFLTQFFKVIFNTAWSLGRKGKLFGNRKELQERMKVYGYVDELREMMKRGTVVLVPTHFSNLDSIMVGYALDAVVGVPAFTYGAGLNLFKNKIVARYMNRLGAYKIDRRKKNALYLETLKSMSLLAIEKGTNCLFFPGGTRSRSGCLEQKLKLGMVGSAVAAQRSLLQKGKDDKIFVVPMVIGYHFVLEGKSLIHQYLSKTGEEMFLPPKRDESKNFLKVIQFVWQFFAASSELTLSFGKPLDVLGNYVDKEGNSLDRNGKVIALADYFKWNNSVTSNLQREREYTRRLGEQILDSFHKDNIVMSSHLVAHAAFLELSRQNPNLDLYGILKLPTDEFAMSESHFHTVVENIRQQLFQLAQEKKIRLSDEIHWDLSDLVEDGLENLGLYHDKSPLKRNKKGEFISNDFALLFFYHNRLANYGIC